MSIRTKKLAREIFRSLAIHFLEFEKNFGIISISNISVAPDLSNAKIFFYCDKHEKKLEKKLNLKSGFFQKILSKTWTAKKLPKLKFMIDKGAIARKKIEKLLEE